jgi:hypothetical protein
MNGKDVLMRAFFDHSTSEILALENGVCWQILEQKHAWPQRRLSQADVIAITRRKLIRQKSESKSFERFPEWSSRETYLFAASPPHDGMPIT